MELSEICNRWEEEVHLMLLEMKNFVKFYTHILIPDMNQRAAELKQQLQGKQFPKSCFFHFIIFENDV